MPRLNIERQKELEPERIKFAKEQIEKLGYEIADETERQLIFKFKGHYVYFYPYSGWHSGETIKDGRGLSKLLKQIT